VNPVKFDRKLRMATIHLYDGVVDVVITGLILLMVATLVFSFFDVLISIKKIIPFVRPATINDINFRLLVENVLDVFVIVELFGAFMDYFRTRHIKLSNLLDVTIVFSLREILVKLYSRSATTTDVLWLCAVVFILVVSRSITAYFSPPAQPFTEDEAR